MSTADEAGVRAPDAAAAAAVRERLAQPGTAGGAARGRLAELAAWAASVQGRCPPEPFRRVRLVVLAADHGVAADGVSADPPAVGATRAAAVLDGTGLTAILAAGTGVGVRLVDVGLAARPAGLPDRDARSVRPGSGRLDRADALTAEEAERAYEVGTALADEEVDAGADLLLTGALGVGRSTPAAVVVGLTTGAEPQELTGRRGGLDDAGWMRRTAALRDGMRRGRTCLGDPFDLLAVVGGADLAALTGLLVRAAERRTPVLLDGVTDLAAALLAARLAPLVTGWLLAGTGSHDPAVLAALARLPLTPVLETGSTLDAGTGGLLALPVLRAAVASVTARMTGGAADGGPAPLGPPWALPRRSARPGRRGPDGRSPARGPAADRPAGACPDGRPGHRRRAAGRPARRARPRPRRRDPALPAADDAELRRPAAAAECASSSSCWVCSPAAGTSPGWRPTADALGPPAGGRRPGRTRSGQPGPDPAPRTTPGGPAIGALGVLALLAVLGVQVTALNSVVQAERGTESVLLAVVAGRLALTWAARAGGGSDPAGDPADDAGDDPAGQPSGPALLAAGVPAVVAAGWTLLVGAGAAAYGLLDDGAGVAGAARTAGALLLALLTADLLRRHLVRRLGALTWAGASTLLEVAATVALVVMTVERPHL